MGAPGKALKQEQLSRNANDVGMGTCWVKESTSEQVPCSEAEMSLASSKNKRLVWPEQRVGKSSMRWAEGSSPL